MGSLSEEVRTEILCGRICDLEAENAKLREQGERLFDKTLEMGTENTKLRGLVRAAWKCVHTGASCSDCRLIAGGCTLQSAMCELGIEEDE